MPPSIGLMSPTLSFGPWLWLMRCFSTIIVRIQRPVTHLMIYSTAHVGHRTASTTCMFGAVPSTSWTNDSPMARRLAAGFSARTALSTSVSLLLMPAPFPLCSTWTPERSLRNFMSSSTMTSTPSLPTLMIFPISLKTNGLISFATPNTITTSTPTTFPPLPSLLKPSFVVVMPYPVPWTCTLRQRPYLVRHLLSLRFLHLFPLFLRRQRFHRALSLRPLRCNRGRV